MLLKRNSALSNAVLENRQTSDTVSTEVDLRTTLENAHNLLKSEKHTFPRVCTGQAGLWRNQAIV